MSNVDDPKHLKIVQEEMTKMLNNEGPGQYKNPGAVNPQTDINPNAKPYLPAIKIDPKTAKILGEMGN